MRISSVEVVPYSLPFRDPYVTAAGRLERRQMALLRLRDEEGAEGLGEGVPLSLRGGVGLERVVDDLRALGEHDRLDETALREQMPGLSPPARCAALTALLDLRGRRAADGEAVGPAVASVPCNATLSAGEPASVAAEAARWAADGFTSFKLKLGVGDEIGQVRAVRKAVGDEARIRVDANAAWDLATAERRMAELEPFEIELVEQPVATLEDSARLAETTSVPIAADESIESRADAERALAAGACSLTGVKLSKVGGPEEAIAIAELIPAYMTSALDGPVGIAAAAQVAATLEAPEGVGTPIAHGLATQRLFSATVAAVECELVDGRLHLPPGPGLGVEIDEEALAAHRL